MLETQQRLKEKASEEIQKRKTAVTKAKQVSQQNTQLRKEVNQKNMEGGNNTKLLEKLKQKNAGLRKQAQDAVIQRSILSTEVKKITSELEIVKKELHKSNVQSLTMINKETNNATINPQKNSEMKQKLKLVENKLVQLEEKDTKRRDLDSHMANVLPKRFKKMIIKQIITQMKDIPNSCLNGVPGRGNINITIEGVPEMVFKSIFKGKSTTSNNLNTKKIRIYLTEHDLGTLFDKTFRFEQSILLPKPRRFIMELVTVKDDKCDDDDSTGVAMIVTYNLDTFTLKLLGKYTVKEAIGMGLHSLGKNIRLG